MKQIVTILMLSAIAVGCKNSANQQRPSTQYEEKKASIADMEKESPLKFLKISGSHRNNLVNRTVVEGEIINKATLTTYKNIEVQVDFKDKEGATIEKHKQTVEGEVEPGGTLGYKIKTDHVKGAESVTIDITDATADK